MPRELADGVRMVGKMFALREDGTVVAVAWLKFPEEADDDATGYEVLRGGWLTPLGWRFETFRPLFEAFTEVMEGEQR